MAVPRAALREGAGSSPLRPTPAREGTTPRAGEERASVGQYLRLLLVTRHRLLALASQRGCESPSATFTITMAAISARVALSGAAVAQAKAPRSTVARSTVRVVAAETQTVRSHSPEKPSNPTRSGRRCGAAMVGASRAFRIAVALSIRRASLRPRRWAGGG